MFLNSTKITRVFLGGTQIREAYYNGSRVWPQVTQGMLDNYINAVKAQRENTQWADKNWGTAGGKWLFGAGAITDHGSWGYPWDTFLDDHSVREMSNWINLQGLHNPGPLNIDLGAAGLSIRDIVNTIIRWFVMNWNPDPFSKLWYENRVDAYNRAYQLNRPPPNPADAVKQWQLLRASVTNLNTIDLDPNWRNNAQSIIDCAKIIFALTHKQMFADAVAAYAKIITDLGGDLPTVP
jgi:hypothetical protein